MIKNIAILLLAIFIIGCNDGDVITTPNILICIADDAGHMGKEYPWVETPAFDRVASEGIIFSNAYTPNAKCAPSRACLLTARNSWQLKEAANHFNNFPAEFKTYPEALKDFGYFTGYTGKGWGPGNPGEVDGKERELCGKRWDSKVLDPPTTGIAKVDYSENFMDFFKNKPDDQPFYFWYGGREPHRRYEYGSSLKAGKKLSDIKEVPAFFPDNDIVRTDMLDYALEIEYFDSHVTKILDFLESKGELDNTIVIVTSDHGMPFPRAKSDEYDYSNHIPLAMMWGKNIKNPGRVVEEYVSLIDVAPTFLELVGINWDESGMQVTSGTSLLPFLKGENKDFRDYVLIGKERHDVGRPNDYGYPIRGIVQDGWMYLRNYRPDLWPACNPECGYSTVDGSPTKTEILESRHNAETKFYWDWSFGKRPDEELFYLPDDPYCISNLSSEENHESIRGNLIIKMEEELKNQSDPRMFGEGDIFHTYEYTWDKYRNLYDKIVINKEAIIPTWINASDIETDFIDE
ncbi:MAG: sulfatase [Bacteroidetes bacterium]|nr:sulfatase [Bacteroidota bacterium]